eukprot:11027617-Lingulodinium_polyedra.AAC.1
MAILPRRNAHDCTNVHATRGPLFANASRKMARRLRPRQPGERRQTPPRGASKHAAEPGLR